MVCGDTPNLTMTTILELTLSTQVSNSSSSVIPWVPPYHSCILLDLNLLTQVKPGTSSSPATRIVAVTWLTYSSTPVATSANSSGSKADATYLSSVWRTNPARVASREKSWAEWRELEPLALSLRLLAALEPTGSIDVLPLSPIFERAALR